MALQTYFTGTVSVEENGTVVTGTDTMWTGVNVIAGDWIEIPKESGTLVKIIDVTDITHLQIPKWTGSAETDVEYVIYRDSSLRFSDVQIALNVEAQVQALETDGFEVFVPPDAVAPDPSIGKNGQYAYQPDTGKRWRKDAGLWTFLGISDPAFSRYDLTVDIPARPASNFICRKWVITSPAVFKAGLADSWGDADVAATNDTTFSITINGEEIATATFAAGAHNPTFSLAADFNAAKGDVARLVSPVRDPTLSDISITIVAFR